MKKSGSLVEIIFLYLLPMIFIGSYLLTAFHEVNYPLNRDYAEGTTLTFIERWRNSSHPEELYSREAFENGRIMGYPVLHVSLASVLSHDSISALATGRVISVASTLGIVLILFLILSSLHQLSTKYIPIIATLFLYQSAVFDWSLLARADMLAAFLEVLGIYAYIKRRPENPLSLMPSLICFSLALLCKQNFITGALLVITLEITSNAKQFSKRLPIYALTVASIAGIITFILGPSYWQHTLLQLSDQQFYVSRFLQLISSYLPTVLITALLAGLGWTNLNHATHRKVYSYWLLFGGLVVLLGIGRAGSNFNYCISLAIPLAALAALGIKRLITSEFSIKAFAVYLAILILLGQSYFELHGLAGRLTYLDHRSWPPNRPAPSVSMNNTKSHLKDLNAQNVFCDEPGICTLLGYEVKYTYFENQMNAQTLFTRNLKNDYDVLLFTEYPDENLAWTKFKLPKGSIAEIKNNYELIRISDLGFIFIRK